MVPELALPQLGALLVLLGLVLIVWAMAWRLWVVSGTAGRKEVGVASVFRIMVGVAGGIVLAQVLLLLMVAAFVR